MSHLLAIAVGPVQEFIAAARRTRDLWFGSYLLSEISRAVAKSVGADGGKLIFPASFDAENVANVILAELQTGEPSDVAAKAKDAAQKRWLEFAGVVQREVYSVIRQDIWESQVTDVIEFYSAWVARSTDYSADRGKLMRLFAGRKSCRDFLPAKGRAGVPKSSLDGQRESVLKDQAKEQFPIQSRSRLRIREGEQLDVIGVVKRVAGGNRPYPSVARIAADPWVRGNHYKKAFKLVLEECNKLGPEIVHSLHPGKFPQFEAFPYEGTAVYPSRHHEWIEESGLEPDDLKTLRVTLSQLPRPEPYLAVIVADGDRMGAAISSLKTCEHNQAFSKDLAKFAHEARNIVKGNNGVLVYAGGDDVLAFLPVDRCLSCARELRNQFVENLDGYQTEKDQPPTLSVGIAIGHFMENLEDLLDYGRAAEKAAKKVEGKDALAVHLHKRGGSPVTIASPWKNNPETRLCQFANLMITGIIPTRLPYELRSMAIHYKNWADNADLAIRQDLYRLISKKTSRGVETVRQALEPYLKATCSSKSDDSPAMSPSKLMMFARELLIARQLATALKQSGEGAK